MDELEKQAWRYSKIGGLLITVSVPTIIINFLVMFGVLDNPILDVVYSWGIAIGFFGLGMTICAGGMYRLIIKQQQDRWAEGELAS